MIPPTEKGKTMTEIDFFENEIIQESKQQAETLVQNAKQEAGKFLEHARVEKERILKAILSEREKEEEQKVQRELSRLRIKYKIELNNTKEKLLNQIFTESLNRINNWKDKRSEKYKSSLANQIIQGGISLEGGELIVKLASEDVSLIDIEQLESEITKITGTKTKIEVSSSKSDAVERGSVICKGSLAIHNTIKARFDRREEFIRDRVYNILFKD